ncbi:hypothetical protein [Nocardioides sp. GXZ039]|uniref:hypothetical protein n=1 Tax=Nocardioides sp. GXZ039 TaxID=3136018 RepID=UPI0030F4738F
MTTDADTVRADDAALVRVRALVALCVATLVALVVPSIGATVDGSTAVALTVLALALTALAREADRAHGARDRAGAVALVAGRRPAHLTSRVTDPVHHPLRPRAPGIS